MTKSMSGGTELNMFRRFLLFVALLFPTACKEILYSELSEIEANEMVAVLAIHEIVAGREADKDGAYSITVDNASIPAAVLILREAGLPKPKFESLGEIFGESGFVGTPFEQHARYIHALNQELSQTLTEIDGVVSARVTVNAPLPARFATEPELSTVSVVIRHFPAFDQQANLAKLKKIVSHAVPNLLYENVSIAFFEVQVAAVEVPGLRASPPPIQASIIPDLIRGNWLWCLVALNGIFWLFYLAFRTNRRKVLPRRRDFIGGIR